MELSLTVILGLPGAGKSTYSRTTVPAKDLNTIRINVDDIRLMFGVPYDEGLEYTVWEIVAEMTRTAFDRGFHVVLDESITNPRWLRGIKGIASSKHIKVHAIVVESPSYLCWKKRESTGFPRAAFERKLTEWLQNKEKILALCDTVEIRQGNQDLLAKIRAYHC